MRHLFFGVAAFAAFVASHNPAQAVTINLVTDVFAGNVGVNSVGDVIQGVSGGDNIRTGPSTNSPNATTANSDVFARATGPQGEAFASAAASVDTTTGQIKLKGQTIQGAISRPLGTAGFSSNISVSESFFVSGTGTLTSLMAVDASWLISANTNTWAFQGTTGIQGGRGSPLDTFSFSNSANSNPTGPISNYQLATSTNFLNDPGSFVTLFWQLQAQISNGNGLIDSSNTASLFFNATPGLTVTPMTASFLSNAAYPNLGGTGPNVTPIPVPPAAFLLVGALAALLGLGRKNQRIVRNAN